MRWTNEKLLLSDLMTEGGMKKPSQSQSSVEKSGIHSICLGFRVTCVNAAVLVFALGYSCHSFIAVIALSSFALISIFSLHPI